MIQSQVKPSVLSKQSPILTGLVLVIIFSVLRAGVGCAGSMLLGGQLFQPTLPAAQFFLVVFAVLSVGLCGVGLRAATGASWQEIGWVKEGFLTIAWRSLAGFLLAYIATFAWVILAMQLAPMPPEAAAAASAGGAAGGVAAAAAALTPSVLLIKAAWGFLIASWQEENLFRGYLQPHLIRKLGHWPGILAQAALFSAAHLGFHQIWWQFVASFLLGLILGWLRGKDRSLVPAFIAHGLSWPLIS